MFLAAAQQQQMIENVKKCKNFLSTLIKLAASQPEATVSNVRDLIQGLIVSTYDIVNFFFVVVKYLRFLCTGVWMIKTTVKI